MSEFEFWKMAYKNGWATREQLDQAVAFNMITAEQRDLIVNS